MVEKQKDTVVGLFDSGIGGLTVMKTLMERFPQLSLVYLADTLRCPYGSRSVEAIIRYSIENLQWLIDHGAHIIVLACNTVSAVALSLLRSRFSIPIIGVIEPVVHEAVRVTKNRKIGIIGTARTINSGVYKQGICQQLPDATVVEVSSPLFVPMIEERVSPSIMKTVVHEYMRPCVEMGVDTLVLGCTHYPLLLPYLRDELPDCTIVNPSEVCSPMLDHILSEESMSAPVYEFFVSDNPDRFQQFGIDLLGWEIPVQQYYLHGTGV